MRFPANHHSSPSALPLSLHFPRAFGLVAYVLLLYVVESKNQSYIPGLAIN